MDTLYNILSISGSISLIAFGVLGIVFIYRWRDRLKIMESQIRFVFEIQNELLLKSKGQTPRRSHFDKDFFAKGEDVIVSGSPPTETIPFNPHPPRRVTKEDLTTGTGSASPTGIVTKKRVTEKSTTNETRNG